MVRVTSEIKGPWLNILLNGHLHMSMHRPSIVKVQSWANHPKWWQYLHIRFTATKMIYWGKASRYYIETTHKNGVQDLSDYADRELWVRVLKELQTQLPTPQ